MHGSRKLSKYIHYCWYIFPLSLPLLNHIHPCTLLVPLPRELSVSLSHSSSVYSIHQSRPRHSISTEQPRWHSIRFLVSVPVSSVCSLPRGERVLRKNINQTMLLLTALHCSFSPIQSIKYSHDPGPGMSWPGPSFPAHFIPFCPCFLYSGHKRNNSKLTPIL